MLILQQQNRLIQSQQNFRPDVKTNRDDDFDPGRFRLAGESLLRHSRSLNQIKQSSAQAQITNNIWAEKFPSIQPPASQFLQVIQQIDAQIRDNQH